MIARLDQGQKVRGQIRALGQQGVLATQISGKGSGAFPSLPGGEKKKILFRLRIMKEYTFGLCWEWHSRRGTKEGVLIFHSSGRGKRIASLPAQDGGRGYALHL